MRKEKTTLVLEELTHALPLIDDEKFEAFIDELLVPGRRVLVTGVGRVLISLKAWVKRMRHLDIDINYVGDETELPLGPSDLLIVASASGESKVPVVLATIATDLGVAVAYVGCTPNSSIDRLASLRLIVPGKSKSPSPISYPSKQPMSTLFEQELFLLGDVIALCIMERRGWTEDDIKNRHANLE